MSTVKNCVFAAAVALVTSPLLLSAQKPAKPPKPGNPAIAYEARTRQAYWDLMVMDADGANQTRLVSGGDNRIPSWSPDGESDRICENACDESRDLYGASRWHRFLPGRPDDRAAHAGVARLVSTSRGERTLQDRVADQAADFTISLFAVDAVCGGLEPQQITSAQAAGRFSYGWSQNDVLAVGGFGGLFVHNVLLDATGAITLGPEINLTSSGPLAGHSSLGATWTEDGTELFVAAAAFQSRPDLWVVSATTSGIAARLTNTPDIAESRVTWSQDFTQFAFDEDFGVILKANTEVNNGVWSFGERVTLATPTRPIPNLGRPSWRAVRWP